MYANRIEIDREKCVGCGLCKRACPGMLMDLDEEGKAFCKPVEQLNWSGCWKCQHCMAVCPQAAISVLDRKPEDSLPIWPCDMGKDMDSLIAGRYSCRHFKQENVDVELVDHILSVLSNAPTGGNKMMVEYTVIRDIEVMNKFRDALREKYFQLKEEGIYPFSWDEESLGIMESREDQAMNGDMFFCSAPHLFIPHVPGKYANTAGEIAEKKNSTPVIPEEDDVDTSITMAYFELLANAHGLGTIFLGFPINILKLAPEVYGMLQIPEGHVMLNAIGFGYPEFTFARGTQKDGFVKINRLKFTEQGGAK